MTDLTNVASKLAGGFVPGSSPQFMVRLVFISLLFNIDTTNLLIPSRNLVLRFTLLYDFLQHESSNLLTRNVYRARRELVLPCQTLPFETITEVLLAQISSLWILLRTLRPGFMVSRTCGLEGMDASLTRLLAILP